MDSSRRSETIASIKESISCIDAFNALFFCASPGHQFDRYYKDGGVDGCNKQINDMKFCLKLKAAGPEETKRLLATLLSDDKSPTLGTVWEAREARGER